MNSAAEIIDRVVNDRGRVPTDAIAALSDVEKMELLRQAGEVQRLLDAVVVETVATVPSIPAGSGTPGFCGLFGCATMNELLQRVLRVDGREAARVVKVAAGVHRELNFSTGGWQPALFPQLREALMDGVIGVSGFALIGRFVGTERWRWMRAPRVRRALAWAQRRLDTGTATVLFTARFVPFARLAINLVAGASRIHPARYLTLVTLAATGWAVYQAAVGATIAAIVPGGPMIALPLSIVVAVSIGLLIDLISRRVRR